ncbi:BgTH12-00796 [Blumeria graminis f. sp. triticale]|uniref:BgTH12-00796 n=1 Tax=Blumeria graminis f. sp. triticale TaxID=1689686 RepID=A0A9W4DNY8_BLUGR|nr:BgTH12-00796 [Blumeria graminis f. sp. triticale]
MSNFRRQLVRNIIIFDQISYKLSFLQTSGSSLRIPWTIKMASSNLPSVTTRKRKVEQPESLSSSKKLKVAVSSVNESLTTPDPKYALSAAHGIVLRKYYPHEMNNARAQAYKDNALTRPISILNAALAETHKLRENTKVGKAVVHWFKSDLRVKDNHALSAASEKAREADVPLLALFILSPQDLEAHLTAPIRVDFLLRSLKLLRDDLAVLNIPLHIKTIEKRKEIPTLIAALLAEWEVKHIFANIEYEVDELRRDAEIVRGISKQEIAFDLRHDSCIVQPGKLLSGTGNAYSVYTPWYRAWMAHVHSNPDLLETFPAPTPNPSSITSDSTYTSLFNCPIPKPPENKRLSFDETKRFSALWPAGEREASDRLEKFCKERITGYKAKRNFPAETGTSSLSPHFALGTLSSRTAVRAARESSGSKKIDGGNEGVQTWISEVAWRDFYRHVLVAFPYVCMNKPFKPEYSKIEWEYNDDHFNAWKEGRTGYPIVDAAMRQLAYTGWMHNRLRMVVASFLTKHLLLDWRLGEQYFMLNLIDGDFASNNGGWGWSAGSGVDPQPYFRIFNPELQSEKFDKEGHFIRKWVPELKGVRGSKPIHDPYGRGAASEAKSGGYIPRIVNHKEARERCLQRYKEGLGKVTS